MVFRVHVVDANGFATSWLLLGAAGFSIGTLPKALFSHLTAQCIMFETSFKTTDSSQDADFADHEHGDI